MVYIEAFLRTSPPVNSKSLACLMPWAPSVKQYGLFDHVEDGRYTFV